MGADVEDIALTIHPHPTLFGDRGLRRRDGGRDDHRSDAQAPAGQALSTQPVVSQLSQSRISYERWGARGPAPVAPRAQPPPQQQAALGGPPHAGGGGRVRRQGIWGPPASRTPRPRARRAAPDRPLCSSRGVCLALDRPRPGRTPPRPHVVGGFAVQLGVALSHAKASAARMSWGGFDPATSIAGCSHSSGVSAASSLSVSGADLGHPVAPVDNLSRTD